MSTHYGVDLKEPLLTQVNVMDNFFPPEVFSKVNEWFTRELHWFYNPYVNIEGDHPDDFQFQHVFLLPDRGFVSGYTNFLEPFFERIPASSSFQKLISVLFSKLILFHLFDKTFSATLLDLATSVIL